MLIRKIKLVNFRNFDEVEVRFFSGINYLLGDNSSGKTNLVEGLNYLNLTRSFRTNEISDLIKDNCVEFYINAEVAQDKLDPLVDVVEIYGSRQGKKIFLNGKKLNKVSELTSVVNTIVFIPDDVRLFHDSPEKRREFINTGISKVSHEYLKILNEMKKILKERNALLKNLEFDRNLLDSYTTNLIQKFKTIYFYRESFIEKLNEHLVDTYRDVSGDDKDAKLHYHAFVDDYDNYEVEAKKKFDVALENDIKNGVTSIGVQKEDISLTLNGKDISIYGSQGENRMAVIALKLALYKLNLDYGKEPILLFDDVLSELDYSHERKLVKSLQDFNQVFITGCKDNMYINENIYKVIDNTCYRKE